MGRQIVIDQRIILAKYRHYKVTFPWGNQTWVIDYYIWMVSSQNITKEVNSLNISITDFFSNPLMYTEAEVLLIAKMHAFKQNPPLNGVNPMNGLSACKYIVM